MNDIAQRIANLSFEQRRLLELMLEERAEERADERIPALPRHSGSARPAVFPLSVAQRRLWVAEQDQAGLFPGTAALRLRGPLDVGALEASLCEICARHEALRTIFEAHDGEPVQIVAPPRPVTLTRMDLRELPPPAREKEAGRRLAQEAERPFDLSRGPMRGALLRVDDEEHVLLLVIHHIVCDAWSLNLLFRELEVLYGASRSGERASLPVPPLQYVDYTVWQRQRLQDGALSESRDYWKKQLAGDPEALDIPTDRPRPPVRTSGGAWAELRMPASLQPKLHLLCRRQHVTLFMTLLAAWATLLHRYSGQEDFLILTPFVNRNRVDVEGSIGFFSNTLLLRPHLAGDPSFVELLGRVRETSVDAFSHGELPFEEVYKEVRHEVRATFFLPPPLFTPKLDGLLVERIQIDHAGRLLSVGLFIIRGSGGLTARLNYDPDLFEAATAGRMLGDLMILLESVVADPEQRISKLPLPIRPARQRDPQVDRPA